MDKKKEQNTDAQKDVVEVAKKGAVKTAAKGAAAGAAQSAAEQALQNVVPTRAAVHQAIHDKVQGIPLVGDAVDAAQKAGYLGHLAGLFKKKK
ncbi:MAG: hypothetical protein Q4F56_00920 [Candidatus Saccharibacteria bacterium]|nr:hypothetical protein [Candidatus Saccharibacteria bacterium]